MLTKRTEQVLVVGQNPLPPTPAFTVCDPPPALGGGGAGGRWEVVCRTTTVLIGYDYSRGQPRPIYERLRTCWSEWRP